METLWVCLTYLWGFAEFPAFRYTYFAELLIFDIINANVASSFIEVHEIFLVLDQCDRNTRLRDENGPEGQPWWRHQMEKFSALLALCAGNSSVTGEFPTQRPVTQSFDVFFDLRLNAWLSKQSWDWWFETPSRPLWRHSNDICRRQRQWTIKALLTTLTAVK